MAYDGPDAARTTLDEVEQRVIGCLVEKELATPQTYPLTANALRLACNQTTNRDPVVAYDDHTVDSALRSLRAKGLIRVVYSPSNRTPKYRHVLDEALGLDQAARALIAVLLLRRGQTVGELKARTDRLHRFADLADVDTALERLADAVVPLVLRYERRPGQKDPRWVHLLGPTDSRDDWEAGEPGAAPARGSALDETTAEATTLLDDERITALEETVAGLTADLAALRSRVDDLAGPHAADI